MIVILYAIKYYILIIILYLTFYSILLLVTYSLGVAAFLHIGTVIKENVVVSKLLTMKNNIYAVVRFLYIDLVPRHPSTAFIIFVPLTLTLTFAFAFLCRSGRPSPGAY